MAKHGMRDISAKGSSLRTATAHATLHVSPGTISLIRDGKAPKGDPLPVARVAAIQAAKITPTIIPYCHPVPVDYVGVEFALTDDAIHITVDVKAVYKTGVEMEALTAAAAAALNLFDLLKPVDDTMEITTVRLQEKLGGKTQYDHASTFTAAVVVVSDSVSAGDAEDGSGSLLSQLLLAHGATAAPVQVVPDEIDAIAEAVKKMSGSGPLPDAQLLFITGGTGLGPRDKTPQAVLPLLDHRLPGIEHRLQSYSQDRMPLAMLGRPFAGLLEGCIVVGVPGSPGAVRDAVGALFPYLKHAFPILAGGGHGK